MGDFLDSVSRCPQLIIYLGLAFMSVGTSFFFTNAYFVNTENGGIALSSNLFMHLFQIFVIGSIFYFLCTYNYQTAGWVLLLFPIIITMLILLMVFGFLGAGAFIKEETKKKESKKESGEEEEGFKGHDGNYGTHQEKV